MALDEVHASCHVKRGRLWISDRRAFDASIKAMPETWQLELVVRRLRATRSVQQNRYWWGVCVELVSEHTGYTPDEVHELAKQMFIPKKLAIADGNGEIVGEYVMGGSTRSMNTAQFTEFIESFKRWAAETLNVYIPDPSEPF